MINQLNYLKIINEESVKQFFINLLIAVIYFCFFSFLFFKILKVNEFEFNQLYNWYSEHYVEIRNNGYQNYLGENGDERAFFPLFPLFPLFWRFLEVNQIGIFIINLTIYLISQSLLFSLLKLKPIQVLSLMSFPSLIFMLVPYSESLFYMGSVLLCYGVIKGKNSCVFVAFFLLTITRPSYSILLPAFIITQFFAKKSIYDVFLSVFYVAISVSLGVIVVAVIQYYDTETWFGFLEAQSKAPWSNVFQVPNLPFRSWGKYPPMPIDALAFSLSVFSLIFLKVISWKYFVTKELFEVSQVMLICMLYVLGIGLAVLFFRGGAFF